jgi:hypothetical protein
MKLGAGAWAMFLAFHAFLLWAGVKLRSSGHPILAWILFIWVAWDMIAAAAVAARLLELGTRPAAPAA